jgi:hypothetical protein
LGVRGLRHGSDRGREREGHDGDKMTMALHGTCVSRIQLLNG